MLQIGKRNEEIEKFINEDSLGCFEIIKLRSD